MGSNHRFCKELLEMLQFLISLFLFFHHS